MYVKGVNDMPTIKPRCTITFEDEELRDKIDTFRFENRYRSQNDAIMAIINRGIEVLTGEVVTKPKTEEISKEDKRVLTVYHAADPVYQGIALEILENHQAEKKKNRA
jgi:hypothetical protein